MTGQQSRLVRIDFGYDWRGRRISKKVYPYLSGTGDNWTASSTPTLQRKFLYDGWNLIAELDGNNAVVRSYLWGLDLAGQKGGGFADAGGIGGLVAVRSGSEAHFYMQDGLGNVSLTYDAVRQTESSRYEFGPFGEILRANGTWTANNPIRYSSKYWDSESDLSYFGYRYYSQNTGRWLNRDPLGESGGPNLFAFLGNAPIGLVDPLGLETFIGRDPCVMCHGVSAFGYNGNPKSFSRYLPGTGPNARAGYAVAPALAADTLQFAGGTAMVVVGPDPATRTLGAAMAVDAADKIGGLASGRSPYFEQALTGLGMSEAASRRTAFAKDIALVFLSLGPGRTPCPKYTKEFLNSNYPRFKYPEWWRDELWDRAINEKTGKVYDITGKTIDPGVSWEVGHHSMTYAERQVWAAENGLTYEQWYEMEHAFFNFRPELPTSNARHIYEKWMPAKY